MENKSEHGYDTKKNMTVTMIWFCKVPCLFKLNIYKKKKKNTLHKSCKLHNPNPNGDIRDLFYILYTFNICIILQ